jgi:hypothetical protein
LVEGAEIAVDADVRIVAHLQVQVGSLLLAGNPQ